MTDNFHGHVMKGWIQLELAFGHSKKGGIFRQDIPEVGEIF